MSFNPKPSKQTQQVMFTPNLQKIGYAHYILMTVPRKKRVSKSIWECFWIFKSIAKLYYTKQIKQLLHYIRSRMFIQDQH